MSPDKERSRPEWVPVIGDDERLGDAVAASRGPMKRVLRKALSPAKLMTSGSPRGAALGLGPVADAPAVPITRSAVQARRRLQLRWLFVVGTVAAVTVGLAAPEFGLVALGAIVVTGYARRIDLPVTVAIYAVVLVLVPSQYTVGSFAVTAAMLVALLTTVQLLFTKTAVPPQIGQTARARRGSPPVVTALLAFAAAMLASYVVSHLSFLPQGEAASADRNLARLFAALALAIACAAGVRSRREIDAIVWALVVAATVAAIIGVLQFGAGIAIEKVIRPPGFAAEKGFDFIESRAGFNRVAGTARHPIEMAVVWAAILPLALYLSAHATRPRARHFGAMCAIVLIAALPLALSRSGLLAAAVALGVSALGWTWSRRCKVAFLGTAIFVTLSGFVPGLLDAVLGMFNGDVGNGSLVARAAADSLALQVASGSLWIGRGFGTFDSVPSFQVANTYLELLIEVGVLGVIAFGLLIAVCVVQAIEARQQAADSASRDLALALIASVLAVCVGGWGEYIFRYPMMMGVLFLALGLIGALAAQVRASTKSRSTS